MKLIGITGPSGSGKSLLCDELMRRGVPKIDADAVYHSLLVPPSQCLTALKDAFGDGVFLENGELDRSALGNIVFKDKGKLELLNSTVLGFVLEEIRKIVASLEAKGHLAVAIDAPTLIESGFDRECDLVVALLCPAEQRIERIMARDGLDRAAAELRTAAQKNDEFYREHAHIVLMNDGGCGFSEEIEAFIGKILL